MKETFYFRHDYNARNDERILELRSEFGWEGYGLYWAIIETIAENDNGGINSQAIGGLSIGLNYPKDKVKKLLDFCIEIGLFLNDDGFIHSKRFDEHLEFRGKLSNAGAKGAKKRWDKYRGANGVAITTLMQSTVHDSKVKESKRKESKFIAPTLKEVETYFKENGYTNAKKAFDYYEAANWHDSKGNPVKNWKQKMQGVWFKDENKSKGTYDIKFN
jgi:hypothetical protein